MTLLRNLFLHHAIVVYNFIRSEECVVSCTAILDNKQALSTSSLPHPLEVLSLCAVHRVLFTACQLWTVSWCCGQTRLYSFAHHCHLLRGLKWTFTQRCEVESVSCAVWDRLVKALLLLLPHSTFLPRGMPKLFWFCSVDLAVPHRNNDNKTSDWLEDCLPKRSIWWLDFAVNHHHHHILNYLSRTKLNLI